MKVYILHVSVDYGWVVDSVFATEIAAYSHALSGAFNGIETWVEEREVRS